MLGTLWRIVKRILIILLILIILAAIGVTIFIMTFDLNRYKDLAEKKLTEVLNRPITIESMHTKLALVPTITITGFKIANNQPFHDKDPLLSIKKMDAELELAPLLNSQLNIHRVNIDSADINLFKEQDNNNWTIQATAKPKTEQKQPDKVKANKLDLQKNLHLNFVNINTLNLKYTDPQQTQSLTINKLQVKGFHIFSGEIAYDKYTFNFTLNSGTIFDLLNRSPNFPIDLKIQSRLINLTLNGKIGDFKDWSKLQATISMRSNNLKNLCNFFKIKHPLIPTQNAQLQFQLNGDMKKMTIPQASFNINSDKDLVIKGSGELKDLLTKPVLTMDIKAQLFENRLVDLWHVQPMNLAGDISISPNSFQTKKITIDANRSDMRVAANVQLKNKKYNISSAIYSDFLNIYDFIRKVEDPDQPQETEPQNAITKTKASTQIPWDLAQKINLNLNLSIKHFQARDWLNDHLGITTRPTLYEGVLNIPFEIAALNGKLAGTLKATASDQVISFVTTGSDLNLNGIRPLSHEVQNVILQAKATGKTKGADVSTLLKNLNGQIVAQVNQGEIINKWLTSLPKMLNLNKKKQNVSFSNTDARMMIICAAANMNIVNGVVTGKEQVALETNSINLSAGGTINLVEKTMDVLVRPSLSDGTADDWLSLSKYIRITGPFDRLTPRVDTEQVTGNLIQIGMNKLIGSDNQLTEVKTLATGEMCQNVLGKDALIKTAKVKQQAPTQKKKDNTQPTATQQPKPAQTKQQFEQELFNSLFQALAPQQ